MIISDLIFRKFFDAVALKEIGNLHFLEELYLSNNDFISAIPKELGQLTELRALELQRNRLSGTLPAELGDMSKLNVMRIGDNELQGTFPENWKNLTKLTKLYVEDNFLSGAIPDFIREDLTELEQLQVAHNQFSKIPDFSTAYHVQLLDVSDKALDFADLEPNRFVSSFFYAPQAQVLDSVAIEEIYNLSANLESQIKGSANAYQWFKDSKTNPLSERGATLTFDSLRYENAGVYWTEITNSPLPRLTLVRKPIFLDVNDPFTNEQDSLALVEFYQKNNGINWSSTWDLEQPVYTWDGIEVLLGRVTEIILPNNRILGKDLEPLGKITNLEIVNLGGNQLSGEIPKALFGLDSLTQLVLRNNNGITGTIPPSIREARKLEYLDLSSNSLGGEIPDSLGYLPQLEYLDLSTNFLDGEIPESLGQLSVLALLDLSDNKLE